MTQPRRPRGRKRGVSGNWTVLVPLAVNVNAMAEEELMAVPDRVDRQRKSQTEPRVCVPIRQFTRQGPARQVPRMKGSPGSRTACDVCIAPCLIFSAEFRNRYSLVPFFRDPVTNADQFAGVDSPQSRQRFSPCETCLTPRRS